MDAIPIPAHTVNEDWEDHYRGLSNTSGEQADDSEFTPDDGSYDHFDGR